MALGFFYSRYFYRCFYSWSRNNQVDGLKKSLLGALGIAR